MRAIGLNVTSLTSLTPKEEISEVYRKIESDESLRLLYGGHLSILSARFVSPPFHLLSP